MNKSLQKRFWKNVTVRPEASGYGIFLDDKQLKTPLKSSLLAPTKAVAEGIAAEWSEVKDTIDPTTMHLTRCANATLDSVVVEHGAVAAMLAEYGATDLICYRANNPSELVERQARAWDPLLVWMSDAHNIRLIPTRGVMHIVQPEDGQKRLRDLVIAFDPWRLTALHDLITISGSFVLGFAVATKHLSGENAWSLSRIDETWQEEQWGADELASKAAEVKRSDFLKADKLMDLLIQP